MCEKVLTLSARKNMQFFGTIQERNKLIRLDLEGRAFIHYKTAGATDVVAHEFAKKDADKWLRKNMYIPQKKDLAQYSPFPGAKGITINALAAKDYDSLMDTIGYNVSIGHFPAGTGTVGALEKHEFGHLLDAITGLRTKPELQSFWVPLTSEEIRAGLSGYASDKTKIGEFIAEAWSEYSVSASPRPMSKAVAEFLLKTLGGIP